jgi:hypothetical protein
VFFDDDDDEDNADAGPDGNSDSPAFSEAVGLDCTTSRIVESLLISSSVHTCEEVLELEINSTYDVAHDWRTLKSVSGLSD